MTRIKDIKKKIALTIAYFLLILVLYLNQVPCFFVRFFNIECLGCGMTRALNAAINFDFRSAFSYHFMFWSMPVLYLYFLFDGNLFKNKKINKAIFILITLGFFINWIKNLLLWFDKIFIFIDNVNFLWYYLFNNILFWQHLH